MKTLHLPGAYLPWVMGGTEIFCHRLCQNLQILGVEALVSLHQASQEVPLGNRSHEGVPIEVLPPIPDQRKRQSLYTRATVNASGFQQLLSSYQPDVVHFHNFTVSQGITHLQLAKQAGCKVVLTYHTPTVSCSQHGLLFRSQTVCDGLLSLQRCSECRLVGAGLSPKLAALAAHASLPWINPNHSNPLIRLLTTRQMTAAFHASWWKLVEQVDAIHVLAEWVRDVVKLNGVPPEKIHLIRTGGPEPVVNQESNSHRISTGKPSPPRPLKLAFVGRSTRIKGIHVLVDAIQQLPRDLPLMVTFFRAEQTWEETAYGHDLQQRMEADDRFEVKYSLPNDQLLQILTSFDLCIVPSLWLETGPLVVLEAFAAGVPVLGSRLGGIAELVRDGIDGLLFEPGNSTELANLIRQLSNHPERMQSLRKNVRPPRTMQSVAKDTLALYEIL